MKAIIVTEAGPPVSSANVAAADLLSPAMRRRLAERLAGARRAKPGDQSAEQAPEVQPRHLAAALSDAEVELLIRVLEGGTEESSADDAEHLTSTLSDADVESLLRALEGGS